MKRDMTEAEWFAKIEWDALPKDFTGAKDKLTTKDWEAWAGYDPRYSGFKEHFNVKHAWYEEWS